MPPTLDSALLTGWTRAATQALERHRAEIDRINVFPVPDGDTGTNLLLTMRAAAEAVRRVRRENRENGDGSARGVAAVAGALARGALVGARGNSGMILSQVLRGVADALAAVAGPTPAGAVLADALCRAHRLATAAVARPRQGTVLSVLDAAAGAAVAAGPDRLDDVALAAAEAAAGAVQATTGQLPELARAGVVDAGGLGLYVVLDALAALVCGRSGTDRAPGPGRVRPEVGPPPGRARRAAGGRLARPRLRGHVPARGRFGGPASTRCGRSFRRWGTASPWSATVTASGTSTCTAPTSGRRSRRVCPRAGRTGSP